jgi:dihydroorotate dehydrogenase (fumarate)
MSQTFEINEIIRSCIEYGEFKLKSGIISNYYVDLRKLYSRPNDLYIIAEHIVELLEPVKNNFNYIAGVPYGAVPLATLVSFIMNKPLLLIRKEVKEYGKGLQIEGLMNNIAPTVCLLEDVITTGSSIEFCLNLDSNINITEICILLDRTTIKPQFNYKALLNINDIRILHNNKSQEIYKIMKHKKTNLILSLDIKNINEFVILIEYINHYICGIKTHIDILDETNLKLFYEIIGPLKEKYGFFWIDDRKFSDIGSIMIKQYENYLVKPDLITVHGISGADSVIELNNVVKMNTGILLIYEMSALNSGHIFNDKYKEYILDLGNTIKCCGYICQNSNEISKEFLTFTPGIKLSSCGLVGAHVTLGAQVYSNPYNKTSDFYIVGRGILEETTIYNKICASIIYRNACFNKHNINLTFNITPDICVTPFFYNAAGVHCTSYNELLELDQSCSGAVLSKTCTLDKLDGNVHPRYYLDNNISINSTGLANDGISAYSSYKFIKPYIISVATKGLSDFKECIIKIKPENVDAIEVNFSCPNIDNFAESAIQNFEKYLLILEEYACVPWGLKMPPFFNTNEIKEYVAVLKKYPVKFIVCANSFPNGLVLKKQVPVIVPRNGLGGIGGCYGFKAIALSNAREFANLMPECVIIGCGGIKNVEDIKDYLSVGCKGVQIGSELDRVGLELFNDLIKYFN